MGREKVDSKKKILEELSEEISFEYELASDTMVFSERYKEVYGRKNRVPHFLKVVKEKYYLFANSIALIEELRQVKIYEQEKHVIQLQWPNKDGVFEWCEVAFCHLVDEEGNVKAIGIWRNIDRNKREAVGHLQQVAMDKMEGLSSKSSIEKQVAKAMARLKDGEAAALFLIDFDDIKKVQMQFGVLALEELLHLFSKELLVHFYEDGLVAHLGSDKFLVYLKQMKDEETAKKIAMRIRNLLKNLVKQLNIGEEVTVTIGITLVIRGKTYKEVVDEADVALRHGKNSGKNKLVMYSASLQSEKYVKKNKQAKSDNDIKKKYDVGKIWPDLLERLFSEKDSYRALQQAIAFIGNVFSLDKIMVWEYNSERECSYNVLQWAKEGLPDTRDLWQGVKLYHPKDDGANVHNADGIFYCTNREPMPEKMRHYAEIEHFHSLLEAKITSEEDDVTMGFIDFAMCSKGHFWVQEEVDLLVMMSRVLGETIRNRNFSKKMADYYDNTRKILDSVVTGICVVDCETRELYYFNDTMVSLFPDFIEVDQEEKSTKSKCFLSRFAFENMIKENGEYVYWDKKIGKRYESKARRIQWENKTAFIVTINEHLASKEELERQKKQEYLEKRYAFIYSHSCDCIFDIDIETDTYEVTVINQEKQWPGLANEGCFSESIVDAVKNYVILEDQKHLLNRFSLDTFRKAIENNESMLMDTFTVIDRYGEMRSKEVRAFVLEEDGKKQVVSTYCDITEQRRKENQILLERQKLNRALVNVYPVLLSINVTKDELMVDSNEIGFELLNHTPSTISGMLLDAAMRAHPQDRDQFLANFNRDHLVEVFKGDRTHLNMELRMSRSDGSYHWISIMCIRIDNPLNDDLLLYVFGRVIDNQKAMEQSLKDALKAAEHASEAKSDFLSRMSHEIRTPMNAIIGMTALSKHVVNQPEQLSHYLEKIDSSAQYLLTLINNILDMSRIESNKVVIEKKEFRMEQLLDMIQTIIGAQARKKNINFLIEKKSGFAEGYLGDCLRLNQVLINLLSNAVKFTGENGHVSLSVKENKRKGNESYICFTIADDGAGMTEEFMKNMYDPFEQENASSPQGMVGTGLGLSITKNLIGLMDGHIKCQSKLGEGTTFIVEIKMDVVNYSENTSSSELSTEIAVEKKDKNLLVGKRILLAEDNELNQEIAVTMLEMQHIIVDCVENGELAVQRFLENGSYYYDMVLMDIRMPVKNGLDATADIRGMHSDYAENIPIVAMSANAFAEDKAKAYANGFTDYIVKPIDAEILVDVLNKYLT